MIPLPSSAMVLLPWLFFHADKLGGKDYVIIATEINAVLVGWNGFRDRLRWFLDDIRSKTLSFQSFEKDRPTIATEAKERFFATSTLWLGRLMTVWHCLPWAAGICVAVGTGALYLDEFSWWLAALMAPIPAYVITGVTAWLVITLSHKRNTAACSKEPAKSINERIRELEEKLEPKSLKNKSPTE